MGMFDYIVCNMPLPGIIPTWYKDGHQFQTKDTPEQYLKTYTIDADGTISGPDAETIHGTIEFYCSNQCGGWGGIAYTTNGEDAEDVSYTATVDRGRVTSIVQDQYTRGPAIKPRPRGEDLPTKEEIDAHNAKYAGPWVGRTIYVLWGGSERGYRAEIVAENDSKVSWRTIDEDRYHKPGELETHHKSFGTTMFLTEEDAFAHKNERTDKYQAALAEFEKYAAEWHKARNPVPANPATETEA